MPIRKPAAGYKLVLLATLLALAVIPSPATAAPAFRFEVDSQGRILPFKAVGVPLSVFVREYGHLSATPITVGGSLEKDLHGTVTLFLRHPIEPEKMVEILYRVLNDNGYAIVDAPASNGWVIQPIRDARDAALPVYESANAPDSGRYVTVIHQLRHSDSESVARVMRSFMPANSRIIPSPRSQIFITDTASNIRKMIGIISRMDTPEAAKMYQGSAAAPHVGPARACGEQRIEKLVVEKLEIHDGGSSGSGPQAKTTVPAKTLMQGAKK